MARSRFPLAVAGAYQVLVERASLLLVCSPLLAIGDRVEITYYLQKDIDPAHDDLIAPWLNAQLVCVTADGKSSAMHWAETMESANVGLREKTFRFVRGELISDQVVLLSHLSIEGIDHETDPMRLLPIGAKGFGSTREA